MNSAAFGKVALALVAVALVAFCVGSSRAESPAQSLNFSTRMHVLIGENVGIGGFIITGTTPKHVVVRALGPSLQQAGISGALADPTLDLYNSRTNTLVATNDNWKDNSAQKTLIEADKLAPSDDLESAIDIAALPPDSYTAIVKGKADTSGVGLIEVYDLDQTGDSKLANISTRAFVETGSNIVIAGFVLGNGTAENRIALRGIGPSLEKFGVSNALPDPQLEVRNASGTLLISNDDWGDSSSQATQLSNLGLAPSNVLESGIVAAFFPGSYTALLSDLKNRTGVGLVEIYDLGSPPSGANSASVGQIKAGDTYHIEKQQVSFDPAQTTGTFVIQVYKPAVINPSNISARAALLGQTEPISFTASAQTIVAALTAIPKSYYAYDQPGNLELNQGSFSYFATQKAVNREPVVTLGTGGTAAAGFTIEFGSLVGTSPQYNTWVAGMPLITVSISKK